MTEHIEEVVEEAAADAGADAGAIAAAVVAPAVAAEAASDAVEEVVEEVRELVERAEDAIETQEDDAQWNRIETLLLEAENRITSTILAAVTPLATAAALTSSELPSSPTPAEVAETADELAEAADELAAEAGEAVDGEAVFNPLEVEQAVPEAGASRRRPRGVGRRRQS